jgi:EmrB/QacA subfamily drug resistance transporter
MVEKLKKKLASARGDDIPADAAEYKTGLRKWLPMIVLSTAVMIIIIDTTILNVSLKPIANDLHTNLQGLQWVITAYSLTLAALTVTGGRLGDLFGRKRMFMLGAVIFAIGSFVTSISGNIGMMIFGEAVIEGIGAALMMPATASLLVSNYKGRDRAIAFGLWGGIAAASSAIGPIVGGFLTTNYSWRWAFRINVFVAIVLLLGSLIIAESRDRAEKRELDFLGVFLSAFGLLAFVYGVIESATYGWWHAITPFALFGHTLPGGLSPTPFGLVVGILLIVAFCWWQVNAEHHGHTPLVSMHLFSNKQFTSGVAVVTLLSLGMVGLIFAIPVFLQSVRNLDALHTGLALAPMSLTMLIVAPTSGFLSKHITPKYLIQLGLFVATIAGVVMHFAITPDATASSFIPGMILFGFGMGLVMAQASNLTMSAVSVEQAGEASGVNNTLRQVGSSFGSAIIGAVLLGTMATSLNSGIANSSVISDQAKPQIASAVAAQAANVELGGISSESQAELSPEIKNELTRVVHQASSDGSRQAILYTSLFAGLGFLASFMLPNVRDLDRTARAAAAPSAAH